MSAFYFAQGGTAVLGVHHTQTEILDRTEYAPTGVYVIVDLLNAFPAINADTGLYDYPTVDAQMQSDSTKNECQYRIAKKVPTQTQAVINGYIADLAAAAANGTVMTAPQIADCATAKAIHAWFGGGTTRGGMLAAQDTLIAANDMQWYLDGKWPTWDPSSQGWSAFVARFQ
jgi:hypothetical protein